MLKFPARTSGGGPPRAADEMALTRREQAAVGRPLMSKPQFLGILPSFWFWQALWKSEPELTKFFTLLWLLLTAPFIFLNSVYVQPFWLSGVLAPLILILGMGLTEKWLRHRIVKKRRLVAARLREDVRALDTPRRQS